jgi:replicative DNA helicase
MQALENIIERINRNGERDLNSTAIKCDLDILNNVLTGGFCKGNLYVIAGKELVGKTAFMVSLIADMIHAERDSSRVGVIAINVSEERWMARLLSNISEVDINKILRGHLPLEEMEKINKVSRLTEFDKIEICAPGYMTIQEVVATCTQWVSDKDVKIIFIDYLQLISVENETDTRLKIHNISKALKKLSVELDVPIIVTVPLQSNTRVTGLKDLRRLGSVENFADVILFLNTHLKDNEDNKKYKDAMYVSIEKNNTGQLDILRLRPLLHIQKFVEFDYEIFRWRRIA